MKGSLLLFNLKLNSFIFSTSLNSSLIIFIRTYTVNCQNALDRLRVRMNIVVIIFGRGMITFYNLPSDLLILSCSFSSLLSSMLLMLTKLAFVVHQMALMAIRLVSWPS